METLSPITYGPLLEETMLTAGLDYYKPTMSQFVHEMEPESEVTFTFKNRGEQRLLDYVDPARLQTRLDALAANGFGEAELGYFAGLTDAQGERMFSDKYLKHIAESSLPPVEITTQNDDLAVKTTGEWTMTTFWETIVMSEINEQYFEGYLVAHNIDPFELYEEGDRRLSEKIAYLQQHPEVKIAEFGTRRRFSLRWQKHVIERLQNECPDNLVGTSNVAFANTMGLKPIGTFAHELPMGYAALADARAEDIRASHGQLLDDWYDFYGDELAIALSDTFSSDFFFDDFTPERSAKYSGTRHDSGDPIAYGEKTIAHYEEMGIDPHTKTALFSDGLNIEKVDQITEAFNGRINAPFGIGTDFTNDLSLRALNIVMKLTHVKDAETGNEADAVKLSDNPGKHTGPAEKVEQYKRIFRVMGEDNEQLRTAAAC
jgi:nicotinate phosphoribosyltransferase